MTGFKNKAGEVVVKPQFLWAYNFNEHGVTGAVQPMGDDRPRFVFINDRGQVLAIAYAIDNGPDYFVNGLARIVDEAGKIGFIDRRGQIRVAPRFDAAESFCDGRAKVCLGCDRSGDGGRWLEIDRQGVQRPARPNSED